MFIKRLGSAVIMLAVTAAALVLGGNYLLALVTLCSLLAAYELLKAGGIEKTPVAFTSYIAIFFIYFLHFLDMSKYENMVLAIAAVSLLGCYVFKNEKTKYKDVCLGFFAIIYVGFLLTHAYMTRELSHGSWFVWLIIIGSSGSDTFAYLFGRLFGKKHFSKISPNKTVEGCIGGCLGTAVLSLAYSFFIPTDVNCLFNINMHLAFFIIGLLCSAVSQIGDLAASAIKRGYDIKDFSNLIPGHGGVLDRIDSIIFVSPFVYYLVILFLK
ncbi:MAG: phosphatidate cytidylyltransferase [Eubacterium sp.]|nr:phosphatidate cytidylyltransferase [Eubacterium sp.]